jgi:alkanesulfonate monooxygenase SsuD/methylene tetrahydromethanopterin reductase-like flavin-dependent oxidoreductase (luciferase family)
MRIGLVVIDEDPVVALRVAKAADRAGIHSIWTIDYYNRASLARAAAFAAATERVRVGTSVTPLFARAPLATAAAVADIQRLSGGRFVFGVGSSTRRMNQDWYGVDLDHPAPRLGERIRLVRELIRHGSGSFRFEGRFDRAVLAHFDHVTEPTDVPVLAAGVGPAMVAAAGSHADGFVGHPIASVAYLRDHARPRLAERVAARGGAPSDFLVTTQIIASAADDVDAARRAAAAQVGFYATVKGYDPLFPDGEFAGERQAARAAFAQGDAVAVAGVALPMTDDRAVYGTGDDVAKQLARYADTVDWALLYPPHFGVSPEAITANEYALIEVASCWQS